MGCESRLMKAEGVAFKAAIFTFAAALAAGPASICDSNPDIGKTDNSHTIVSTPTVARPIDVAPTLTAGDYRRGLIDAIRRSDGDHNGKLPSRSSTSSIAGHTTH